MSDTDTSITSSILETTEDENLTLETISDDVENTAQDAETVTTSDEGNEPEELFYEIDGEQISEAQVKEWKSSGMMQADYSKKTQAIAEERKAVSESRVKFDEAMTTLEGLEVELTGMLGSDDGVNMEELRQFDTAEYLRVKEQKEARTQKLNEIRQQRVQLNNVVVAEEQSKLATSRGWVTDSEKQQAETKLVNALVLDKGLNKEAFGKVTDHTIMSALIDAAKYHDLQKRKASVTKLVKAAPKESSASKPSTTKAKSMADVFYNS